MSPFGRLFGKKGGQPTHPNPQELQQLVKEFLETSSLDALKNLLKRHPELLSDEADSLIESLIPLQTNEEVAKIVSNRLILLRQCRTVGIDMGLIRFSGGKTARELH